MASRKCTLFQILSYCVLLSSPHSYYVSGFIIIIFTEKNVFKSYIINDDGKHYETQFGSISLVCIFSYFAKEHLDFNLFHQPNILEENEACVFLNLDNIVFGLIIQEHPKSVDDQRIV